MSGMVLNLLHAIRDDISEIRSDMREVKCRLTALATQVGAVASTGQSHGLVQRLDQIGEDIGRIRARLEAP